MGDSISDVPMFRVAGFSAVVSNAPPELKKMADYVSPSEYGRGFYEIVDHMIREEMF